MTDNGTTTEFELDRGGEPHSWTLRGPARHRWNGAVLAIVGLRPGFVAKYVDTRGIPLVGDLVDTLVRRTAEDVLDIATWHGRLSITFRQPGRPLVVSDETGLDLRSQRLVVPTGDAPATVLVFGGGTIPD
ncbi:hypothetical protein [Umezawaea sp. Da 62-37]|uniref:hypothetical protein n=1 Tax=Umezawaea sp. Da 62-37 TaxID=3075927 RepID=UPI0028F71E50|nr:hypothetical protein [Umezawaea sp. Da 62-37]WNV86167.1 hypothetical protein RM788_49995 [Umezawaea sp. Da 62-37]